MDVIKACVSISSNSIVIVIVVVVVVVVVVTCRRNCVITRRTASVSSARNMTNKPTNDS